MPNKFLGLLVGLLLLIVPASAGAAVSVRAESGGTNALVSALVSPTNGPVSGDGGVFACNGAGTAAGALNAATGGDWSGQKFTGIDDFQVGRITSEDFTTAPSAPYYWSLNINEEPASAGICGTSVGDGDRVLLYKACNMATSGCYSGSILRVIAPAVIVPGVAATFTVEAISTSFPAPDYIPTTTRVPAAGAAVVSGGSSGTTGADGKVALSLPANPSLTLRATRADDVPDQTQVCVAPIGNGVCAPPDKAGPKASIAISERKQFRGKGPRSLRGAVSDPSGIAKLQLRLTSRPDLRSDRCRTFDAKKGKFVTQKRCGALRGKLFTVDVTGGKWSYLLPEAPGKGRYVLDVLATDSAGNKHLERVIFFVK